MNIIERIQSFELPLEVVSAVIARKIKVHIQMFDLMDKHDGWLPYPAPVLGYLEAIGAKHWADLYFREGRQKVLEENKDLIAQMGKALTDQVGVNPSPEAIGAFFVATLEALERELEGAGENPEASYFGAFDFESNNLDELTPEERRKHCEFWVNYHVCFYNDLSLATHGESIFSLVERAAEHNDDVAMVKAIQIDRTLLAYFRDRLWRQSMGGNNDFFDSLSYRTKKAPLGGKNEHPLLSIFLNQLYRFGCLRESITSRQILDEYQKAVANHPMYSIEDELVVQRQRRRFLKLHRQPK